MWITEAFQYAGFFSIVCGVNENRLSWKELVLGLLTAASGIISFRFWHAAFPVLTSGNFGQYAHFIPPVASILVAATFFSLTGLLIKLLIFGKIIVSKKEQIEIDRLTLN